MQPTALQYTILRRKKGCSIGRAGWRARRCSAALSARIGFEIWWLWRMRTVSEAYQRRVQQGELVADPSQGEVLRALDDLLAELNRYHAARASLVGRLLGRGPQVPQGLYLWGGVGRGKTMLMDLFYELAPKGLTKKRRHFHAFMAEVHDGIQAARRSSPGDPIPIVARGIVAQARLLCFDELHVTDIADAMILGRLFGHLFDAGVVVVATSNVPPDQLYKDGLNRALFVPFIELIKQRMAVRELVSETDHRMRKLAGRRLYFSPLGAQADAEMDALWNDVAGPQPDAPAELTVAGRQVAVPAQAGGAARFTFDELCDRPLGARDYLAMAHAYHTLFVDHVPQMTPAQRNQARRFINLVDTLYDSRVCLVLSAAAEPDDLYAAGDGSDLFERTASRLIEMRSAEYLADRLAKHDHVTTSAEDDVERDPAEAGLGLS